MNLGTMHIRIRSIIREPRENFILDTELTDWLNDASFEVSKDINYPWKEWDLHGIEETADYTLPTDFIKLHPLLDCYFDKQKLDKHDVQWLERNYPDYQNATGVDLPDHYYIRFYNKFSLYPPPKLIASGTATAGSGTSTLVDSSASFSSDYIGYSVRNITDGSNGLITAVTSTTQLTAALTGGTDHTWTSGDTYKINKAGTVPYVYKETAMSADADEHLVAAKFPYLLIYKALPIAELKCYRTDNASLFGTKMKRYDDLYAVELARAMKVVNEMIRGHNTRTVVSGEL